MKKLFRYGVMLAVALACIIGAVSLPKTRSASAATADMSNSVNGITFAATEIYDVPAMPSQPLTFEAEFRLPADYNERAGVLIGNYISGGVACICFEIQTNGNPKMYFGSGPGDRTTTFLFSKEGVRTSNAANGNVDYGELVYATPNSDFIGTNGIDVATGKWVHMAVTCDLDARRLNLYINGTLIAYYKDITSADCNVTDADKKAFKYNPTNGYRVGGDMRTGNAQYFKGEIRSAAMYSDVRTADEVKQDFMRKAGDAYKTDTNLLAAYDFTASSDVFTNDLSGNSRNITFSGTQRYAVTRASEMGMRFEEDEMWMMNKPLASVPKTVEAEIYFPAGYTDRGGVILGSYDAPDKTDFSFEINTNVHPRYRAQNAGNDLYDYTMANGVTTGEWVHLTLVNDEANGKMKTYLNGVLAEEKTVTGSAKAAALTKALVLGGDRREGNTQCFKGRIRSVALFDDVRSDAEILADKDGVTAAEDGLIALYDLNGVTTSTITDLSGNGYDIKESMWLDESEMTHPTDYAYSFAVVGDTQNLNYRFSPHMDGLYKWIADNKTDKKIAHVFGLGDVTEKHLDIEWTRATDAIKHIEDAEMSYTVVRGNHDAATDFDGAFAGNTYYTGQLDGFYAANSVINTYKKLEVAGVKYLLFTLDYGASDEVLSWASTVIKDNPDHRVILTTHAYAYRNGTTLDQTEVCPPATTGGSNNGDHMWDKFVRKHGNIFLVLSGHDPYDNVVRFTADGYHGNEVNQMLVDFQTTDKWVSGGGMVTMLYFSTDGTKVSVETYSTVRKQYFKTTNQFEFAIDGSDYAVCHEYEDIEDEDMLVSAATCTAEGVYRQSCECGEAHNTETFTVAKLDHVFTTYTHDGNATCTSHGTETAECDTCDTNATDTRNATSGKLDHVFTTYTHDDNATCTSHGTETAECDTCDTNATDTREATSGMLEHTYVNVVDEDYFVSGATCVNDAVYKKSCEDCGIAHATETFEAEDTATGVHIFTTYTHDGNATCTGHGTETAECDTCDTNATNTREATAGMLDHSYGEGVITTQPTVEADGEKTYTCTGCGATKTEKVDKLPAPAPEKSGCSKESLALALSTLLTLVAAAFIIKK